MARVIKFSSSEKAVTNSHFMSLCTSGSTKPEPLVSWTCNKADQRFFDHGCSNSLINVILPRFLQVQDFFYISASLVRIQEMMLWFMLAIISSGAPNQFLILFKFSFNGDASTKFLLLCLRHSCQKTY